MTKEFIPYEEALALKELGFDEPCFAIHSINLMTENEDWELRIGGVWTNQELVDSIKAPTYSQAFRWFREKYDLVHRIDRDGGWWICTILNLYDEKEQGTIEIHIEHCYPDSYEEAELACLIKLIEIVKTK